MTASLQRFHLDGIRETGRTVGDGAYTTVIEYEFRGLTCVGKKMRRLLYDRAFPDRRAEMLQRFEEECELLSRLHHPSIVQFLGVHVEPGSVLPVLVMEYLPTGNLSGYLDRNGVRPDDISYGILRDVALGLRYLHEHTPPIVHRDLSANNVLLTTTLSAKISDLGVAKIIGLQVSQHMSTNAQGTPCYMPPEALIARPNYTAMMDSYSFGVMILHVLCGRWPFPTAAFRPDPQADGGFIPVVEVDRRAEFLQQIGGDHPLSGLIHQCLSNVPQQRPEAVELFQQINFAMMRVLAPAEPEAQQPETMRRDNATLRGDNQTLRRTKRTIQRQHQTLNEEIRGLVGENETLRGGNHTLRAENQGLVRENGALTGERRSLQEDNEIFIGENEALREANQVLSTEQDTLSGEKETLRRAVQSLRDENSTLSEENQTFLEESQTLEGEIQILKGENEAFRRENESLKEKNQAIKEEVLSLRTVEEMTRPTAPKTAAKARPITTTQRAQPSSCVSTSEHRLTTGAPEKLQFHPEYNVYWRRCADIPVRTSRAQVVVVGEEVYVGGGDTYEGADGYRVFKYTKTWNTWSDLPHCSVKWFGMAQFKGRLLTVGGYVYNDEGVSLPTPKVFTLSTDSRRWEEIIPPMPSARCSMSVVTTAATIVTAGGYNIRDQPCTDVEVYGSTTSQWYNTDPLPVPRGNMSSVIIHDILYLLGGKECFRACLSSLILRAMSPSPPLITRANYLWKLLPPTPLKDCSLLCLNGSLVAVGGLVDGEESDAPVSEEVSLSAYAFLDDAWVLTNITLPAPQKGCCAAQFSSEEVIVVGGWGASECLLQDTHIGTLYIQ